MNVVMGALVEMLESTRTKDEVKEFDLEKVRRFTHGAFGTMEKKILFDMLKDVMTAGPKGESLVLMSALVIVENYIKYYPDVQAIIDAIKQHAKKMDDVARKF